MGSKQALLPFIIDTLSGLEFDTALDAFSGSGCVGYAIKEMNKKVLTNDHMKFAYHIAKATIENNSTKLNSYDVQQLLKNNVNAKRFITDNFNGLYFSKQDNEFLDNTISNIQELSPYKKSLALAALSRACMKKRPRGIFTFTGNKGFDGRKDLKISMKTQFLDAITLFNNAVFSNGLRNKSYCLDVYEVPRNEIDLVYIDTPYVSGHSDCDYTRRYHFVEGLCSYWSDKEIQEHTTTKKFKSYPTDFKSVRTIVDAFRRLFEYFKGSKIVVSYGSNGKPNKKHMIELLGEYKKKVYFHEISHTYYFGNHGHKKGNENNCVKEYLFVGV
ncbi:DNA adenine methylase [bacterium]|nr:DNA adenine methylase [bacterium]